MHTDVRQYPSPPLTDFFEETSVQNEMFPLNSFSSGLQLKFNYTSWSLGTWSVFGGLRVFTECVKIHA